MKTQKTNSVNLTNATHSINYALNSAKVIEKLDSCKSKTEIYDLVQKACSEVSGPETIKKRDELLSNIENSYSLTKAKSVVVNFFLKGEGLGVI